MNTTRLAAVVFSVACTFSPAALGQKTWVVDSAGGGDFRDLPAAFRAAADGDTLRVRCRSIQRCRYLERADGSE